MSWRQANFMKAAPVIAALSSRDNSQTLVHTGQHYDANMSDVFFHQLGMPDPDVNLEVGSGSHAEQTAEVMVRLEKMLLERKPDWWLSTGCELDHGRCPRLRESVCTSRARGGGTPLGRQIHAGRDQQLVTDQIADLLFTPSVDGNDNLAREGVPRRKSISLGTS